MDEKKIKDMRRRLSADSGKLIKSINRNRTAVEEITLENTEDEGDLATISHEKELLYNLHENDFAHLKLIQRAIQAIDRGSYGECVRCNERINDKRLDALPWATLCVHCQEETEARNADSRIALPGQDEDEPEP